MLMSFSLYLNLHQLSLSLSSHVLHTVSIAPPPPNLTTPRPLGVQPQLHPKAVISGQTFIPVYAHPALHHQPIEKPQLPRSAVHIMQGQARQTRVLIGILHLDYSCVFALAPTHHSKHAVTPRPPSRPPEWKSSFKPTVYHMEPNHLFIHLHCHIPSVGQVNCILGITVTQ